MLIAARFSGSGSDKDLLSRAISLIAFGLLPFSQLPDDRVAVSVAGVIEPALQAAEMRRSAARPTTDLSAYDLYLRALAAFHQFTRERVFEALAPLPRFRF
jgi:hypothetical protein